MRSNPAWNIKSETLHILSEDSAPQTNIPWGILPLGALTWPELCHSKLQETDMIYQGHVRFINILAWLQGFQEKSANFLSFFCLSIPKRDLDTNKTTSNKEVCRESYG